MQQGPQTVQIQPADGRARCPGTTPVRLVDGEAGMDHRLDMHVSDQGDHPHQRQGVEGLQAPGDTLDETAGAPGTGHRQTTAVRPRVAPRFGDEPDIRSPPGIPWGSNTGGLSMQRAAQQPYLAMCRNSGARASCHSAFDRLSGSATCCTSLPSCCWPFCSVQMMLRPRTEVRARRARRRPGPTMCRRPGPFRRASPAEIRPCCRPCHRRNPQASRQISRYP